MKKLLSILAIAITLLTSNNISAQTTDLSRAKWLLGKWENQTARGKMIEEWSATNNSGFMAKSYMITPKDTIILESVELKNEDGNIYYIPTVKGQNNEQPVKFKLTSFSDQQMVFENPEHDFPQKISYTLQSDQSLLAEISGTVNGQVRSRKFPMKKVDQKD